MSNGTGSTLGLEVMRITGVTLSDGRSPGERVRRPSSFGADVGVRQGEAAREAVKIFTGLGASAAALITRQKMRQLGIRSMDAPTRDVAASHAARLGLVGAAER